MADNIKTYKTQRIKILVVGLFFLFFYGIIIFRSYQLQILGNSKINNLAKAQYNKNLTLSPQRGTIYDRNGETLALDILVSSIGVHPHLIGNKEQTTKILQKHTSVSSNKINKKLASKKKFEWIQRRIPLEKGKAIEKAKLKGIQIVNEYRRFYPNKELAGQLLGAVGYDARALGGLELSYDKYLRSSEKTKKVKRDARGKLFSTSAQDQDIHHIYLSIDKNIQSFAETALTKTAVKHGVKTGFAIVADVNTGEIYAMANYPKFNPNTYWKYAQYYWKNHAILDVFEPGSTFKSVLMAAVLTHKTVKPSDKFFCEDGSYKVGKNIVSDHDPYGWLTVSEIIKVSSNIGTTKIAQKLGNRRFYDYILKMGFGEKTAISLGGESPGSIRPYKQWQDIDLSNIAFGQGISVNGLQMVSAYSAIANGGDLIEPHLVKKIVKSDFKSVLENTQTNIKTVLNSRNSETLKSMLHMVTQEGGTAPQAHVPGYLAAGKTGTAQKYDNKLKKYTEHQYVSSFIGFSPLEKPKLLVYVVYDTPRKNGYYGGSVAGPVFKEITERSIKYLGMTPPRNENKEHLAKFSKKNDAPKELAKDKQPSDSEKTLMAAKRAIASKKVPNLKGLSLRQVLQLTQSIDVSLNILGNGFVITQAPSSGGHLNSNKKWNLVFNEKS